MRIANTRVVIKPAMIVLILAVVVGAVAIPLLRRDPVADTPSYGYVNPQTWKFEAGQGAQATVVSGASPSAEDGGRISVLDLEKGSQVQVIQVGSSADSVYLRNALNLDLNRDRKPMRLTFEGRAGADSDSNAPPFPVTFIVRDSKTLLWSDRLVLSPSWKQYDVKIQLKQSNLLNVIMAIHLGEKVGTVQLRNLHVVNDTPS